MRSGRKLSRRKEHRTAMLANLAASIIKHGKVHTTDAKAKEVRPFLERLVTFARRGDLHARRIVLSRLKGDQDAVKKLFGEIGPRYASRPGGYTRILKLGFRQGDNSPMSLIEFVEDEEKKKPAKKSKAVKTKAKAPKKAEKTPETVEPEVTAEAAEKAVEAIEEAVEQPEEVPETAEVAPEEPAEETKAAEAVEEMPEPAKAPEAAAEEPAAEVPEEDEVKAKAETAETKKEAAAEEAETEEAADGDDAKPEEAGHSEEKAQSSDDEKSDEEK